MKDHTKRDSSEVSSRDSGQLRIAGIHANPGPDGQDRLRRLFSLLVTYATREPLPISEADPSSSNTTQLEV